MVLEQMQIGPEDAVRVSAGQLRRLVSGIFQKLNVPLGDADIAANVLVTADLRGVDTHGVSNYMEMHYIPGLTSGRINARPDIRVLREAAATALVDGDGGLGLVVGYRAMEVAIRKAREAGAGFVTVTNSRHFGMAGYYPMMALEHDMIGLAMTAAGPSVVPTFGRQPMLGTNPLSVSAPTLEEPPFVLDMATSTVAVGKLLIAQRLGHQIPQGWALDEKGEPTTDPAVALAARSLLPLGGTREMGSHKGYGLAVVVDILCSVLSGLVHGAVRQRGEATHFFGALDIGAFQPVDEFKRAMDAMIRDLHNARKAKGHDRIYVAGEIEAETAKERTVNGIPLHKNVVRYLNDISRELGVRVTLGG